MVSKAIATVLAWSEIEDWPTGKTAVCIIGILLLSLLLLPVLAVAICIKALFIK